MIDRFNQYLAFDKWQVIRNNDEITFKRLDKVILESTKLSSELDEEAFLKMSFNIDVNALGLNKKLTEIIHERLTETEVCIRNEASLAAIFLIGSMMEGNLLGMATEYPCQFNQDNSAPRNLKTDKVRRFYEWTLKDLIDVATEIGILKHDTKKFREGGADKFLDLVISN